MGLMPLSKQEGYAFPEGEPDVRGWEVRTLADERRVGRVEDVLIDDSGALLYLDVEAAAGGRHALVPVARARVDEAANVVWIPGMTREEFEEVPAYAPDAGEVTPEYGDRVWAAYGGVRVGGGAAVRRGPAEGGAEESGRLASLGELDGFDVADEEPDPRGWDVIAADGRTVGKVHELVVDTVAMKVRYLDCDVDEEALGLDKEDRHILVPIGYARLDEPNEKVVVDAISAADVRDLPVFERLPVTPREEDELRGRFLEGVRSRRRGGEDVSERSG